MRKMARLALVPLLLATVSAHAACTRMGPLDRGLVLYEQGRFHAAHRAFDDAVRLWPDSAEAWNNRGLARLRMGQPVGALGDLTKAMELAPLDPEIAFNRGNVYLALGNHDFAIQDFNRAVMLQPAYARAYWNRGTAQLRRGDRAGAEADWRYAIRLESDPAVRTAMIEGAGLVAGDPTGPTVAAFAGAAPDVAALQATSGAFQASGTDVSAAPPPAPGEVLPSAMPALPAPSVVPQDATELALRGVSRELAGDRAGAIGDLREAVLLARDPQRRAAIERLLRSLEGVQ